MFNTGVRTQIGGARLKAVVVEDDRFVLATITARLAKKNIDVVPFDAMGPARDFLVHEKVCLAIVDLQLPDGDGIELVKFIRESDVNKSTPVIIATANRSDSLLMKALGSGGAMFVAQKPIDWACLEYVLDGTIFSTEMVN